MVHRIGQRYSELRDSLPCPRAEADKVVRMRKIQERFAASGIETLLSTPEEFQAMLESETLRWGKVVKAAGIKPE